MAARKNRTEENRTRSREDIVLERRKVRSDLEGFRNVMSIPEEPGLMFRYVNDSKDPGSRWHNRVEHLKKLGWYVYEGDNVPVGDTGEVYDRNSSLGSGAEIPARGGITAVLMCIPKEIWDADMEIKMEKLAELERGMEISSRQAGLVKRPL